MAITRKKGTLFGRPREQVVRRPGAFKRKAAAAGMSVRAFARRSLAPSSRASTRTKKQAVLARTFQKWARQRRRQR